MEIYYVYVITNLISGMFYIGCCKDFEKRWNEGLGYQSQESFFKDIRKYGWGNFGKEIIFQTYSGEEASIIEGFLIREAKRVCPKQIYNLSHTPYHPSAKSPYLNWNETSEVEAFKILAKQEENSKVIRFFKELSRKDEVSDDDIEELLYFWSKN